MLLPGAAAAAATVRHLDLDALRTAALHTARGVGDAAMQAMQRRVAANNSNIAAAASAAVSASASDQDIVSSSPSTTSVVLVLVLLGLVPV